MPDGSAFTDIDTETGAGADPGPDPWAFAPPLQNWREEGHGRRTAPDEVWAAVRDDYLAGLSAPEVCRRHGVRLSAMRSRAAREGWRRIDQPWAPRNRLDPDDEGVELEARVGGDLDKVELRELSFVAARRAMRAVMQGDAAGALRWLRVRDAMDADAAEMERDFEQNEAIWEARRRYPAPDAGDDVDALDASYASDGVFDPADPDALDSSDALDGVFRVADGPEKPDFPDPNLRDNVGP